MTSSFGTIVGKERDKIPGYGVDNYEATEADLTNEVNNQITANQNDTRQFYNEMAAIQKTIAETPLQNLQSLAQFSQSASQAIKAFQLRRETQEKINEAMDFLDKNSSATLRDAEGKLNLEDAKFNNQLLNENTDASMNFLRARNVELPQDVGVKQIVRELKDNYYGSRQQYINENGGQKITDSEEFIKLHNAADELMITAMLDRAQRAGVDTNSREFRKAFYTIMYPDIKQRRDNNIQSWKSKANRDYEKNRDEKLRNIIVDTLAPYQQGDRVDIDVQTLVETIQATRNFDTPREAVNYLFEEVAAEVGSDQARLKLHHLNYLFEDALYTPSYAPNTRVTYQDGNFKDKDANASLIQKTETRLAEEQIRRDRASKTAAQNEINQLEAQYPSGVPDEILERKLLELDQKFPNIDVSKLQTSSRGITNGGEYSRAGQGDPLQKYNTQLKEKYETELGDKFNAFNQREVERAQGALALEVERQTKLGVDFDSAVQNAYQDVEDGLLAGNYSGSAIEQRRGKKGNAADIAEDGKYLRSDIGKVRYQGDVISSFEKQALADYKRHLINPEIYAFPEYFTGVTAGTKLSARQYAYDRLNAVGGLTDRGLIKTMPYINKDGVLVDTQFDLTQEELNELEVRPNLTKTYNALEDPVKGKKILNGFKTGNSVGTFDAASGPRKRNADKLTLGQIVEYADRGATNFGLYGLTAQEIKDATRFLSSRDFDRVFDEKTQSFLVKELIRQRANRTNSIRGAIIQAKKGGEATIFRGDEREGRWDRLFQLGEDEQELVLNAFPALRNIPANQFHNLTEGVFLGIEAELQNYQKNREKAIQRIKRKENKTPTTLEELEQVPAVKKAREGR